MLLKITNKCFMNCSHCSEDSDPDGKHMTMNTFEKSIEFIKRSGCNVVMITGGEPTTHPNIIEIIKRLQNVIDSMGLIMASNGMFLSDTELLHKIIDTGIKVQITNDSRFYPTRIEYVQEVNFVYENRITVVAPFGRALKNGIKINRFSPSCFNIRSVTKSIITDVLKDVIKYMEFGINKFCVPSIDVDGSIRIGEHNSCFVVGNVDFQSDDFEKNLLKNIRNCKCNKCELYDNLELKYRKAVGEE